MCEIVLYYKKCTEKHTNKHHNYIAQKTELIDANLEYVLHQWTQEQTEYEQ